MPIADTPILPVPSPLPSHTELGDTDLNIHGLESFEDPSILSRLSKPPRKKERRGSGSSHYRDTSSSARNGGPPDEEREVQHLKAILRSTHDRLDSEIRRSNSAETRAQRAEAHASELAARLAHFEQAQLREQTERLRWVQENSTYKARLDMAERDLYRAQADMDALARDRDRADADAAKARDTARKYELALKQHEARDEGWEHGRMLGEQAAVKQAQSEGWEAGREVGREEAQEEAFEAGRADGFEAGRFDGFEEGRKLGYDEGRKVGKEEGRKLGKEEGLVQGRNEGRKEERQNAMQAFDRFLATEDDNDPRSRTQRWVESPYHIGYGNPSSPPPRPVWIQRRVQGDNPTFGPTSPR
ncbi:hypothetical protein PLICRDRAFT_36838 [Plicaturopsis crispa FD-325 SS-3]|nr:hypothetical protein PLICRDRAFT_36838 [Plicaturopsis crispa FD-325 SS-3]